VGVTPAGMDGRVGDVSLIQVGVAMPPSRLVEKGKEAAASGGCAFGVQCWSISELPTFPYHLKLLG
jgi:hypothetical protein